MAESALSRGWGRGWPTDRRADMAKCTDGNDVTVYVHKAIAELVTLLMRETERRGYAIKGGQTWGYASRPIRGSSTPSNHSWGLAIDINAPANPMTGHLVTDMPVWMRDLWKSYGFRWGGDYGGRKDAMHFEYMGTPTSAAQHTLAARAALGHVPVQPSVIIAQFSLLEEKMFFNAYRTPDDKGIVLVWPTGKQRVVNGEEWQAVTAAGLVNPQTLMPNAGQRAVVERLLVEK